MSKWAVLVNNGYTFEYEGEICAKSAAEARKIWKRRGDHLSSRPFRVSRAGGRAARFSAVAAA